jgi:putative phage-type endonuclease
MNTILTLVQGTEEWHKHRLLYRNASESAAVMGISPWISPYQLWEIKTGRRVQEVNYAMQRGTELEPKAREAYELATGYIMEPAVMINGEYSASLDGISLPGDLILEVKCPMKGRSSETWIEAESGQVQKHYYWQVQQQLMVTGATKAHFYVFDGKDGIMVEVLPNPEDMELLQAAWDDFMVFVTTDSPPPLTPMDTVIREDAAWQFAAQNYIARKEQADIVAKAVDEAKAELVALAQHNSERGYGVSVCKYWKGSKQGLRVTVSKGGRLC